MRRMVWLVLIAVLALPAAIAHGAAEKRQQIPLDGSPSLGPADAPVTICEFIDFQ